jgi:hypothetical protein
MKVPIFFSGLPWYWYYKVCQEKLSQDLAFPQHIAGLLHFGYLQSGFNKYFREIPADRGKRKHYPLTLKGS